MYASELMELARKNPEKYELKKYKLVYGKLRNCAGEQLHEITIKDGEFFDSGYAVYVNCSAQLEEIKKPVTYFEAAKACLEGKKVSCKYKGQTRAYERSLPDNRWMFSCSAISEGLSHVAMGTPTIEETLYGAWYIESEDE